MILSHSKERARHLASLTIGSLADLSLPPTPHAYAVFYAFHAGAVGDLVKDLNGRIAAGASVTDADCATLFTRYFTRAPDAQAIADAGNQLQDALGEGRAILAAAGRDADRFDASLREAAAGLASVTTASTLGDRVERIRDDVGTLVHRLRRFADDIEGVQAKVASLTSFILNLAHQANTDDLTGLANRKRFEEIAKRLIAESAESGAPLSLIMADIDNFKVYNDRYGHTVGDQVLRAVARSIAATVRETDFPARFGGEEFAILMPGTTLDDARTVAGRLLRGVSAKTFQRRRSGETIEGVTLSLGLALYAPEEPLVDWIARADSALYAAKHAGRNRFAVEQPVDAL